jgi:uncharacterized protein YggE
MKSRVISLIALCLFSISAKCQFFTTPTKDNTLMVEGVAITKVKPENIFVLIKVKSESKDYSQCQDMLLTRIGKVKSSILSQNIDKDLLKANEITINENKEYVDGRQEKIGYSGTISLSIETSFTPDFASKLLTALKIDSIPVEYNIRFKLSEDQKSKLRQKAINLAVTDAKEKAKLLANASNIELTKINSITYLDEGSIFDQDRDIVREEIQPQTQAFMVVGSSNDFKNIDFNPKEVGIYKSVHIQWGIAKESKKN